MTADECYEIILCDFVGQNRADGGSIAQNGNTVAKFINFIEAMTDEDNGIAVSANASKHAK